MKKQPEPKSLKPERKAKSRIYWQRGHAYGDFRDFRAEGGRREALKVPGERRATTDAKMAEALLATRLTELTKRRAKRQGNAVAGLPAPTSLEAFAAEHLVAKQKAGKVTEQYMGEEEMRLQRAIKFFGSDRDLSTIKVTDVRKWNEQLDTDGKSAGTRRHHLNALSNLFRRAQAEEKVTPGYNPVSAMMDKPTARVEEAHWLPVPEAALLLEAARTYKPQRNDCAAPFAYPLIATALLTGGRPAEVLGLEVADLSFDRKLVTFRPNEWRRLKTLTSFRSVPLCPQLEEILRAYVFGPKPPARLLFPSWRTGEEGMLTDCRKMLDAVAKRVGYKRRTVNMYDFRHTYCAARLQTLDGDAPVSPYTVGKELGHGGASLVNRVYGHLGTVRHRANAVEFRVEQYKKELADRLRALAAATYR